MAKRPTKTILSYFSAAKKKNTGSEVDNEPDNADDKPSSSSAFPEDPNEPSPLNLKPIAESDKDSSKDSIVDGRDPVHGPSSASRFLEDGPFQPDCTFPVSNGRKFRKEWFSKFKWLEYSPALDKAFCFPCRVFPGKGCMEEAFRKHGFNNWKKCTKRFTDHQNCLSHCAAIEQMITFRSSQQKGSVASQLSSAHEKEVTENREYLLEVVKTLLFCARTGIALRGHDESHDSPNRGNFLSLMELRADDNSVINKYFKKREKSFSYVQGKHQNELLSIMKDSVLQKIAEDIQKAGIFAIIADETQDISRYEQVAVVLRHCDDNFTVHESFVGFYRTDKTDGETLASLLKEVVLSLGLDIKNIRAQCYDGAANMRGSYKGVAARILADNPLAMYVHCHAHILNLCIVDMCRQVPAVGHLMTTMSALHNFMEGSAKRHAILDDFMKKVGSGFFGLKSTLKSLSDTRWSCRADALKSIFDNFDPLLAALEAIAETDPRQGGQASMLLGCIRNFEFLFTGILMHRILTQCNMLSKELQSHKLNYASVKTLAGATVDILTTMRSDDYFEKLWTYITDLCKDLDIPGPAPRRKRAIPPKIGGGSYSHSVTEKDRYRVEIFFAALDKTSNEIKVRFEENDLDVLIALQSTLASTSNTNDDTIRAICREYDLCTETVTAEINMFNRIYSAKNPALESQDCFQSRLDFFQSQKLSQSMTNVQFLFRLFLTIPMNSATCERSFSCLRRLKTYLRNSTGQERLSSLAVLNIERTTEIDMEKVVSSFATSESVKGRRLALH